MKIGRKLPERTASMQHMILFIEYLCITQRSFPMERIKLGHSRMNYVTPDIIELENLVRLYNEQARVDANYEETREITKIFRERLQENRKCWVDQTIDNSHNKSKTTWRLIDQIQKNNDKKEISIY
ncbi:hypothetical protein JTB14_023872 [Gonioctena quinquepunctata]|nr:hypothetical protein JTB14_023872 [Gonioctena quinquepunctata]